MNQACALCESVTFALFESVTFVLCVMTIRVQYMKSVINTYALFESVSCTLCESFTFALCESVVCAV